MNEMLAALKARRAVACADERARRRRWRPVVAAAATIVAGVTTAYAEERHIWVDPSHAWSVDLATSHWMQRTDVPPMFAAYALVAAPQAQVTAADFRICMASETFVAMPASGADQLRQQASHIDLTAAQGMYPDEVVERVAHGSADGIAIVDVTASTNNGQSHRRHRTFSIPVGQRGMVVELTCHWRAGASPAQLDEINNIFNSLHVLEQS